MRAQLLNYGFSEVRVDELLASNSLIDVSSAISWLLENGEEDTGGAVEFKHCTHLDDLKIRLLPTESLVFGGPCSKGCSGQENWLCLSCGDTLCGRYSNKHSLQHWKQTQDEEEATITVSAAAAGAKAFGHCVAIGLSDLSVWCYQCDSYVEHARLRPLVRQMQRLKFGESASLDPIAATADTPPTVGSSMQVDMKAAHGLLAEVSWALPTVARVCSEQARPGYRTMLAHEYLDTDNVLKAKVKLVADLIRKSKNCVAYTGAGISTASGIDDYATKAVDSIASSKKYSPWEAIPTLAHRVLVGLHSAGFLKHWVQQNHDGLPQKAGFPQNDLNEIHGAWFDPSNPVVPMSGSLRTDLIERLLEWEEKADLCLALGTSMVGMNADRIAVTPAEKFRKKVNGSLGTVIVALQQTQYDSIASVRIFATLDVFAKLLAEELRTVIPDSPKYEPLLRDELILHDLPYTSDGKLLTQTGSGITLDLRPGSKLRVVNQPSWDQAAVGNVCVVVEPAPEFKAQGNICVRFGSDSSPKLRVLGRWMLEAARRGELQLLPLVPAEDVPPTVSANWSSRSFSDFCSRLLTM